MSKSRSKITALKSSERLRRNGQCLNDKRKGELAVPLNLRSLLSAAQLNSVQQMEGFGWRLAFVRRSSESLPMVVVKNHHESSFAILNRDGVIDTSAKVRVRP